MVWQFGDMQHVVHADVQRRDVAFGQLRREISRWMLGKRKLAESPFDAGFPDTGGTEKDLGAGRLNGCAGGFGQTFVPTCPPEKGVCVQKKSHSVKPLSTSSGNGSKKESGTLNSPLAKQPLRARGLGVAAVKVDTDFSLYT